MHCRGGDGKCAQIILKKRTNSAEVATNDFYEYDLKSVSYITGWYSMVVKCSHVKSISTKLMKIMDENPHV